MLRNSLLLLHVAAFSPNESRLRERYWKNLFSLFCLSRTRYVFYLGSCGIIHLDVCKHISRVVNTEPILGN